MHDKLRIDIKFEYKNAYTLVEFIPSILDQGMQYLLQNNSNIKNALLLKAISTYLSISFILPLFK